MRVAVLGSLIAASLCAQITPNNVNPNAKQGNGSKFQLAGVNSNVAGQVVCNDGSGSTTTTGCIIVSSFKGRSGVVSPTAGDYNAGQVTNAVDTTSTYPNPNWLTSLAFSKLTGIPTLVLSFNGRTGSVSPAASDYSWSQIAGTIRGNTTVPQMASGGYVSGHYLAFDANGNAVDGGVGTSPVSSVFGQTGTVNTPVSTTDISTPSTPGAGTTKWYTKAGLLCSLNSSAVENCTGGGGGAVSSVFGQTGAVSIPVDTTDIATPAAPVAGHTKWYTKGGFLCSLDPSSVENCTGGGGGSVTSVFGQTGVVTIPVTTTDITTPAAPSAGTTKWYTKGGLLCSLSPASAENCVGAVGGNVNSLNTLTGVLTLAGTSNQVIITPSGGNTLTFSLPQSIGTGSSPSFAQVSTTSSGFYAGGVQVIDNSRNGTFNNVTVSGTCTGCSPAGGGITSINALTGPAITIAGTTNQVVAVASSNTVTLSTPQAIATTSAVTFGSVTTAAGGAFNAVGSGTSITFQNSNAKFQVDNLGSVSAYESFNATGPTSTYKMNGAIVLDSSRNAIFNDLTINQLEAGQVYMNGAEWQPSTSNTVALGDAFHEFKNSFFNGLTIGGGTQSIGSGGAIFSNVVASASISTPLFGTATINVNSPGQLTINGVYSYPIGVLNVNTTTQPGAAISLSHSGSVDAFWTAGGSGSTATLFNAQGTVGGSYRFTVYMNGHVQSTAGAPTLAGGSGCSLAGGSNDVRGKVTCTGSGTPILTFNSAYSSAPACVVSGQGSGFLPAMGTSSTTTTLGIYFDYATTASYMCWQ